MTLAEFVRYAVVGVLVIAFGTGLGILLAGAIEAAFLSDDADEWR